MSAVRKLSRQRTKKLTGRVAADRPSHRRLRIESLEQRQLLSAVAWTGAGGNSNWDNKLNWSTGSVPGAGDAVSIILTSAATVTINSGDNESIGSLTTGSTDTLKITGGSLTIAGTSTLSGPLTMTGGYLEATGSGVDVTVNGTTTVSGASLYAEGGATLNLPNLKTYTETDSTVFEATGLNSTLDLSALTTLGNMTNWWYVEA
ncbi:MAG: hypothetical protein ACLQNE_13295, partial [Thermoguttaceae bacterium]